MYGSVSGVIANSPSHANSVSMADKGRKSRLEVRAQLVDRRRELLPTPRARADEAVAASQQQSMLGRPSCIVVRTLGVPHHDVREAKLTTFSAR